MQDTQAAIQSLQNLSASERQEALDHIARANAADLSVTQLQGVLVTQATALESKYKATIDTLTQNVSDLTDQNLAKDQQITDLQAQLAAATTPPTTPPIDPPLI